MQRSRNVKNLGWDKPICIHLARAMIRKHLASYLLRLFLIYIFATMSTAPNRTKLRTCLNALELISKLGVIHKGRLKRKADGYPKVHKGFPFYGVTLTYADSAQF